MLELKHPNIFGNGQSISLFLERGGRRENYEISFQDPWVFGHPTSFGFDIFNTRRTLDLYTETRRGGGVNVGRIWPFKFPDYTRVSVGYSIEDFKYSNFDPTLEESSSAADGIPDALPADLATAPALNDFAVKLYMKNVPPNVFSATVFSEQEKAKARKALPLVVEAYDKAIGLYDRNESFFYGRAQALNAMFTDTKDASLKERALADLDKALTINANHSPSKALKEQLSK